MMKPDDFRLGDVSVPGIDGDDLPECCFRCAYLLTKEFSVSSDGQFYYFCAYNWPDKITQTMPPCLAKFT